MSGTTTWLLAAGAIGLLIVSYWLRFWVRREVIYRPLRERRDRADARRRAESTSDHGASTALPELTARTALDLHRPTPARPNGQFRPPLTTDPSATERIAPLASTDRRSRHA